MTGEIGKLAISTAIATFVRIFANVALFVAIPIRMNGALEAPSTSVRSKRRASRAPRKLDHSAALTLNAHETTS